MIFMRIFLMALLLCIVNRVDSVSADSLYQTKPASSFAVSASQKVEIFVTSWCKYCKALEAFLAQNRIRYTRYDVEKDAAGKKKYDSYGAPGFPLVKIGSKLIYGFDPAAILNAIRKEV